MLTICNISLNIPISNEWYVSVNTQKYERKQNFFIIKVLFYLKNMLPLGKEWKLKGSLLSHEGLSAFQPPCLFFADFIVISH